MRTLKKTLCLILALVMVLGLGAFSVVSADDETEETVDVSQYQEAIDVVEAIGLFIGGEGVDDTTPYTREQVATILYRLDGVAETTIANLKTAYTDVQGRWSEPYIAYAEKQGYIKGYGDGTFGPEVNVTSFQFALMLGRVLGYDDTEEGLLPDGSNWQVVAAKIAKKAELDVNLTMTEEPMTRAEAKQMSYNAIFATPEGSEVQYKVVDDEDATEPTGLSPKTTFGDYSTALLAAQTANSSAKLGTDYNIVRATEDSIAETVFDVQRNAGSDEFYRPGTRYDNDDDVDLFVADKVTTELKDAVTGKDFYSAVGRKAAGYKWTVYVDGAAYTADDKDGTNTGTERGIANGNTTSALFGTGIGDTVEIYVDSANEAVKVVIINTYIGTVGKPVAAKGDVPRYVPIGETGNGFEGNYTTEDFAEKDVVIYNYSKKVPSPAKDNGVYPAGVVGYLNVALAETVTGTLFKVVTNTVLGNTVRTYTIDGTEYKSNEQGAKPNSTPDSEKEQTFYVDANGNIMDVKGAKKADAQYMYVVNFGDASTDLSSGSVSGKVYGILTDGTYGVYDVTADSGATTANWATYTSNVGDHSAHIYQYEKNGDKIVKFKPVTAENAYKVAASQTIKAGQNSITASGGTVSALTSSTKFYFVTVENGTVKTLTTKTGSANLGADVVTADHTLDVYVVADKGEAKTVFIVGGTYTATDSKELVYLSAAAIEAEDTIKDEDGTIYQYTAITGDDEEITVNTKTKATKEGVYYLTDEIAGEKGLGSQVTSKVATGSIVSIAGNVYTVSNATETINLPTNVKVANLPEDHTKLAQNDQIIYVLDSSAGTGSHKFVAVWFTNASDAVTPVAIGADADEVVNDLNGQLTDASNSTVTLSIAANGETDLDDTAIEVPANKTLVIVNNNNSAASIKVDADATEGTIEVTGGKVNISVETEDKAAELKAHIEVAKGSTVTITPADASTPITITGNSLIVDGKVTIETDVVVNGNLAINEDGELTIDGNLTLKKALTAREGTLTVTGQILSATADQIKSLPDGAYIYNTTSSNKLSDDMAAGYQLIIVFTAESGNYYALSLSEGTNTYKDKTDDKYTDNNAHYFYVGIEDGVNISANAGKAGPTATSITNWTSNNPDAGDTIKWAIGKSADSANAAQTAADDALGALRGSDQTITVPTRPDVSLKGGDENAQNVSLTWANGTSNTITANALTVTGVAGTNSLAITATVAKEASSLGDATKGSIVVTLVPNDSSDAKVSGTVTFTTADGETWTAPDENTITVTNGAESATYTVARLTITVAQA